MTPSCSCSKEHQPGLGEEQVLSLQLLTDKCRMFADCVGFAMEDPCGLWPSILSAVKCE